MTNQVTLQRPLLHRTPRPFFSSLARPFFLAAALLLTPQAKALEFSVNPTGVITATGDIVPGDAEAIAKLITLEFKQEHRLLRDLVTVNLHSRGGSLIGGIRLGYALRELGVHTNVGPAQSCLSACALAFLGGQARTVDGQLGVHAAGLKPNSTTSSQTQLMDTIQALGAITTSYVHEMTGSSEVALLALATSNNKVAVLTDAELVSMRAITVARRPSQYGQTGFRCPATNTLSVLSIICVNLDVAQLDLELNDLYGKIRALGAPANLAREQQAWLRYRNSCVNDSMPNGHQSIILCVRTAYEIRRDQLQAISLDLAAKGTDQVRSGWAPIPELK